MKVLTFVVIVSLFWHAWVGMRDIWMDYVKPVGVRLALQVLTIVWLVGCAGLGRAGALETVSSDAIQACPARKFDVVIVGAGGSGMRASLQLARPA